MIIDKNSAKLEKIKSRGKAHDGEYLKIVSEIIARVEKEGDAALFEYTQKFDKFNITKENITVSEREYNDAFKAVDSELVKACERAAENILAFHKLQLEKTWYTEQNGTILGQKITPLERVGVYVPGGKAAYFSSALMNILPAKAAGVENITMVTPANSGVLNPMLLVAAKVAGADKVCKIGGAQAIAALAYGTESVAKVDKITGPGNIYVATAKKLVFGQVDIDMVAGPSEILIIADSSANAEFVAADMLAQCEHDELASAVCITPDRQLASKVEAELKKQVAELPKKDIASKSLAEYSAIIISDDIDDACTIANSIAPEHLELYVAAPMEWLSKIKHAGAIFLGGNSPEALGDYAAGPNHVLPTGATARFFSPLGAYDFIKRSSIIYFNALGLEREGAGVIKMAEAEGLAGHARSVAKRLGKP